MNRKLIRLSAAAFALAIFVFSVSAIAARPWQGEKRAVKQDPRLSALAAREQELQQQAKVVRDTVKRRWHVYKQELKERKREIRLARQECKRKLKKAHAAKLAAARTAAATYGPPVVSIVTLPPVTNSKSS
jgi:hypothetical protein